MAAAATASLKTAFPDRVTTEEASTAFETYKTTPWSQTCWEPAAAYIELKTAEEVAKALQLVKEAGVKFAVRSTGHNPNPGFSSADASGVVLDIRQLQTKELGDGVAKCGAGNIWGEIYAWLEENNLSAIGGRDRQVGLSGFLLGGGMGAFPNLHGLGADGVKNFQVALPDGRLVDANPKENPDLYRALKGGGSNFGIVTRFDLETHPLIKIQYKMNMYNPDDYVNINKATLQVQEAMEKDPKIGLFTNFNAGFCVVGLLYADQPETEPEAFKPLNELSSLINTVCPTTNGTLLSLAVVMGHVQEAKKRYVGTLTTENSQDMYDEAYKIWDEVKKGLPEDGVLHYTIQPVGTGCVTESEARGGNTMGLDNTPQNWWVFTCEWPQNSDDAACHKVLDTVIDRVTEAAKAKDQLLSFQCMSFAKSSQKVLGSYGANNVKKLQETAAKFDSEGVLQKLQNNGFLLRNAV